MLQVKHLLAMPAFCITVQVQVLATLVLIQLPADVPGKAAEVSSNACAPVSIPHAQMEFNVLVLGLAQSWALWPFEQ